MYSKSEKIIHNKFRANIIGSGNFLYEDALSDEAWAWTYVYLKHLAKPISEWLKMYAESEYTSIGSDVRTLQMAICRGRLNMDNYVEKISNMRNAKDTLKYYGYN